MNTDSSSPSPSEREAMRLLVERIKAQRLARNWSQSEFAKRAGVSRATIANLEGGFANLSLLNLVRILSILGLLQNLTALVPAVEARSTWESAMEQPVRRKRASTPRKKPASPKET